VSWITIRNLDAIDHNSTTTLAADTPFFRVSAASWICDKPPLMIRGSGFASNCPLPKASGTYFLQTASPTSFCSTAIETADTAIKHQH
jgi:hypothetical protein